MLIQTFWIIILTYAIKYSKLIENEEMKTLNILQLYLENHSFLYQGWDIVCWKSAVKQKPTKIVLYRVDEKSKQYCLGAAYRSG